MSTPDIAREETESSHSSSSLDTLGTSTAVADSETLSQLVVGSTSEGSADGASEEEYKWTYAKQLQVSIDFCFLTRAYTDELAGP